MIYLHLRRAFLNTDINPYIPMFGFIGNRKPYVIFTQTNFYFKSDIYTSNFLFKQKFNLIAMCLYT